MNSWDPELYDRKHAFVWQHGAALLELLQPRAGERVLDLGCGTGKLTAEIATAGASVIGIDSSATMIEQARGQYPQLTFAIGDARSFAFPQPFDGVFSNAVLHWVHEPEQVIACVHRALKPGGRFVAEFGGKGNVQAIIAALDIASRKVCGQPFANPWYYPGIAEYTSLLEKGGLEVTFATLFDRPTSLEGPDGLRDWVRMFAGAALDSVPEPKREAYLRRFEEAARTTLFREGGWFADYRRLRVVAWRRPV
jgi:trans-aconitate 2-methyltransferase